MSVGSDDVEDEETDLEISPEIRPDRARAFRKVYLFVWPRRREL